MHSSGWQQRCLSTQLRCKHHFDVLAWNLWWSLLFSFSSSAASQCCRFVDCSTVTRPHMPIKSEWTAASASDTSSDVPASISSLPYMLLWQWAQRRDLSIDSAVKLSINLQSLTNMEFVIGDANGRSVAWPAENIHAFCTLSQFLFKPLQALSIGSTSAWKMLAKLSSRYERERDIHIFRKQPRVHTAVYLWAVSICRCQWHSPRLPCFYYSLF